MLSECNRLLFRSGSILHPLCTDVSDCRRSKAIESGSSMFRSPMWMIIFPMLGVLENDVEGKSLCRSICLNFYSEAVKYHTVVPEISQFFDSSGIEHNIKVAPVNLLMTNALSALVEWLHCFAI